MKYKVKITGFRTFGKKRFARVANEKNIKLYNVFGFGVWFIKEGKNEKHRH